MSILTEFNVIMELIAPEWFSLIQRIIDRYSKMPAFLNQLLNIWDSKINYLSDQINEFKRVPKAEKCGNKQVVSEINDKLTQINDLLWVDMFNRDSSELDNPW